MKASEEHLKDGIRVGIKDRIKGGVNVGVKLNESQKKLLGLVLEDKNITQEELAEKLGISTRTVERNIADQKERGLLVRIGSDKTGYWKVEGWTKNSKKDQDKGSG